MPISGQETVGLLQGKLQGPDWLSGGAFGAEASIAAVAVCFGVTTLMYRVVQKRGSVMPPFWKRPSHAVVM